MTGGWFDQTIRTDVSGYPTHEYAMSPSPQATVEYEKYTGKPVGRFSSIDPTDVDRILTLNPHPEAPTVARQTFTASSDGELFVYVNDALLMFPSATDLFYRNNSGTATLTVRKISDATQARSRAS